MLETWRQPIHYSLALSFFGIGMKTHLFQSCGHCWVFQISWHIDCSTFTASSFRIWNSSTRIPSSPLALFVVLLPKAHLILHSRMSGSKWVIPPLITQILYYHHPDNTMIIWVVKIFLYSSSVYSCHLFLMSSASVRSIPLLSFTMPILCMKYSLGSSDFLEVISSLSHSIVFLYFFALFTEEGFLISPCYSLELCIQMDISFLFSFAFHFPSSLSYL